jgi:hypothetical protein
MEGNGNGATVWKWISGLLASLVLGMWLTYLTLVRGIVTQDDLARQLKPIDDKADKLLKTVEDQGVDIQNIKTNVAVMNDKIPDKPVRVK